MSSTESTVDLAIEGMTCASCVARVEKRLNRLDGVSAQVNLATEKARVSYPDTLDHEALLAEVGKAGYTASVIAPARVPEVPAIAGAEHPHDHSVQPGGTTIGTRFLVSAILTIPVIVLAMVPAWQFTNWQWLSLALAAPVVVWGGAPFHRATWTNLRHGALTMDTLITLGTLAAFGWSLYALFFGAAGMPGMRHEFSLIVRPADATANVYLEVAAGVTLFLLLGRLLEDKSKRQAGAALRSLLELGARDVTVLRGDAGDAAGGREVLVPISELAVGDLFVVRPGEKVATDGTVVDGASALDQSMLTGESVPVDVGVGDQVTGATIAHGGRLVVRATRVGADTQLAQMAKLVEEAQLGKAAVQRLADRIAGVFVPVVIVLAVITLAGWLITGEPVASGLTAAIAVLIIACPCALGLATPTALLVGTGRGAQLGIFITGAEAIEQARAIDTVVLDKTGTVTEGRMSVREVTTAAGVDRAEALRLAAALERHSEHPIAGAVVDFVGGTGGTVADFRALAGSGVSGSVDGHAVLVGRPGLLADHGIRMPQELAEALEAAQRSGATAIVVAVSGSARAVFAIADTIKPTSAAAVASLAALGLRTVLLTGDSAAAAHAVADAVGIREVVAETLPADKVDTIKRLQASGATVVMVGDGVNDAAALAQADLGMTMGTGTDAAINASDITLASSDLRQVADAIRLSRRTMAVIRGNLFWAFAYNVVALPVAAFGLLNPMIAGAAMAFSSVFVVLNSLRLRRFTTR